jgi:protein-disulfide isomerase
MNLKERVKYANMKARHKEALLPWYLKPWGVFVLVLLTILIALIIASSAYVVKQAKMYRDEMINAQVEQTRIIYNQAIKGDIYNKSFGPQSAPLSLVMFSDFTCPVCAEASEIIEAIKVNFPDQVHFIYRDFPLENNSLDMALAAHCAGDQQKFWEMHKLLMTNQNNLSVLDEEALFSELNNLASSLNIQAEPFAQCLLEQKHLSLIANDFNDAELLGLEGTPTWFFNDQPYSGYLSKDHFLILIDSLINDPI